MHRNIDKANKLIEYKTNNEVRIYREHEENFEQYRKMMKERLFVNNILNRLTITI